jgi:glucans biosynthesis protein C
LQPVYPFTARHTYPPLNPEFHGFYTHRLAPQRRLAMLRLISHRSLSMTQTEFPRRPLPVTDRRYDLDWLRVLAFAVLILYHIGMYYVADWGWHIKSSVTSVPLQDFMILTNPWRMSLLFLISAMALSLVQQKMSAMSLLRLRSSRLLIPLLFGMFVIVVPQVYFEARSQNLIPPGYLDFWWHYINPKTDLLPDHHSPIGLLTWNHLWFLPYLWCYSMLVLLLRWPLNALAQSKWLQQLPARYAFLLLVLVFVAIVFYLRPLFESTNALVDDWYNHARYFGVFIAGYLLAQHKLWWQAVIDYRRWFLVLAVLCYSIAIADRHQMFPTLAAQFETSVMVQLIYRMNSVLNHWGWLFAVLGYAGFWLNRPGFSTGLSAGIGARFGFDVSGNKLRYCTQAILPWYLLHQTLIIVFASWLKPLAIPASLEAVLLLLLTCAGCYFGYELIRRVALLRWLCGVSAPTTQRFMGNGLQTSMG